VASAALSAASKVDSLTPLLDLLEPKQGESSQVENMLSLLEKIAESQIRLESKLVALERKLGVSGSR